MSKPITLFRPRRSVTSDDGGTTIVKYSLPPPIPAPYEATHVDDTQQDTLAYIPSLHSICLKKLSEYPNQLHVLDATRIQYKLPEIDGDYDLLREVIPTYAGYDPEEPSQDFLKTVDPRMWATLIQIYTDLPATFRTYQLPLSDAHLPLLQDIPSTPNFSLVTVLELRNCRELDDTTIGELGQLHGLAALDVSATTLTSYGVKTLAKTLVKNPAHSRVLSGPWGLRMLSLRDCMKVNDEALASLTHFPLLSVIDLRGTCCSPAAYGKTLFTPCAEVVLYHPTPLRDALSALATKSSTFYSHPEPFFIHVNILAHHASAPAVVRRPGRNPGRPGLPPSLTALDVVGYAAAAKSSSLPPDVVTLVNRQPSRPPRTSYMDIVASLETQRLASEQASRAFYSAFHSTRARPVSASRPAVFNHPQSRKSSRPKPSGSPQVSSNANQPPDPLRLYRDPPPWSVLDDIQSSAFEDAFTKATSRSRTQTDDKPQSSQALVESKAARQSVRAVFGLLEKRIGGSASSSGSEQPSHPKATRVNPFSREMVRSVFATSNAKAEPETPRAAAKPADAKHVHKKRRVSLESGVPEDEGKDPSTPKSTLAVPPRSTKPLKPIFSLPRPIFPEQEAARKPKVPPQTPTPTKSAPKPSPSAAQANLSSFASDAVPAPRPPGTGFRPDRPSKTVARKASGDSGRPSGVQLQPQPPVTSAGKKKRKSTDSSSSFDWKSWGS